LIHNLKHTIMSVAALNFKGKPIDEKIVSTRNIVNATTGNINYTSPSPSLANITTSVNALEQASLNAKDGGKAKTTALRIANTSHNKLMASFTLYVNLTSGGDKEKIESTTLNVKGKSGKPAPMTKVMSVRGKAGFFSGQINVRWKGIRNAKSYIAHKSANGNDNWVNTECTSTKASMKITGLATETAIFIRVAAINSLGKGAWSDPIRVMAG